MLNLDDDVEMNKTEDEMAGKPRAGALVLETESGDQHIIPLTVEEKKAITRDGEMECNKHTEEPGCFCEPFPTLKNENIWIHRKRG